MSLCSRCFCCCSVEEENSVLDPNEHLREGELDDSEDGPLDDRCNDEEAQVPCDPHGTAKGIEPKPISHVGRQGQGTPRKIHPRAQRLGVVSPETWTCPKDCTVICNAFQEDFLKEFEHVPTKISPDATQTYGPQNLDDIDIQTIFDFFSENTESPVLATLSGRFSAYNFVVTTWSNTTSGKCRFEFTAKPKQNGHSWEVKGFAPAKTKTIMWLQMDCSEDRVTILQCSSVPEVKNGRNFFVDTCLMFEKNPAGGVKFEIFTYVRWLKKPSGVGWAARLTKEEAMKTGKETGEFMARHLQKLQAQRMEALRKKTPANATSSLAQAPVQEVQSPKNVMRTNPVASPRLRRADEGRVCDNGSESDARITKYLEHNGTLEQELSNVKTSQ